MAEPFGGNSFLKVYLDSCKRLVKTVVIKSTSSVELINTQIRNIYGSNAVDDAAPETWKYYLNISGNYHATDTVMTVTSLDTLLEVNFTKENLLQHTATAEAYSYGSRFYYSLLYRYPSQEQLILGILNPVNIDKAIDAANGTILGYPNGLVEPQEQTLIGELEQHVKNMLLRWDIASFSATDSLYSASQHAILYLSLLPKLLNLRLKRCKTNEVHSFHVREYLASNHRLDRYLPYMTLKQALYFYRNINYIERNEGTTEQFKELVQKILTDRRIPLSEYSIRHLNLLDDNLFPLVTARRKPINTEYNSAEKDYVSIETLYRKENNLAYYNPKYYEANTAKDLLAIQTARSSVTQCKDLESDMVDYSESVPDPMIDILLRQLTYMAGSGLYNAIVNFRDPKTGLVQSLSAKDAVVYMLYIAYTAQGVAVEVVPKYIAVKYKSSSPIVLSDLLEVVDYVSYPELIPIAQSMVAQQALVTTCYSVSMFHDVCTRIYQEALRHWYIASSASDFWVHGQVKNMISRFYELTEINLAENDTLITDWLNLNNLQPYNHTYEQAHELVLEIFKKSTGLVFDDTKNPASIQKALVSLLTELSSYTIQVIREINTTQIIPLNWSTVRIGEPVYYAESDNYAENAVSIIGHGLFSEHLETIDLNTGKFNTSQLLDLEVQTEVAIALSLSIATAGMEENVVELLLFSNTLNSSVVNYDINEIPLDLLSGLEEYDRLTSEQKQFVKFI